jgi:hypothetical protein
VLLRSFRIYIRGICQLSGKFCFDRFNSRRTVEEKRRKDAALDYIESQIRDLYGPLPGFIQQSENKYNIARRVLPGPLKDTRKGFSQLSEDQSQSWIFFVESYFILIHEQARSLISSKTHLLEQTELPKSLCDFLNYAADLECRHKLYLERKIDTRPYLVVLIVIFLIP